MNGSRLLRPLFVPVLAVLATWAARPAAAGIDRFTVSSPLNGDLVDVVVDPFAPGSLLAVTRNFELFRSADGGHTWSGSGAGPDAIAADPSTLGSFYGIVDHAAFHSTDGGRHWTEVASGLDFEAIVTPHSHSVPVLTLLPDSGAPPTLLATGAERVQRSDDGGATWSTVFTSTRPATGWGPVADPTDPRRAWLSPPAGGLLWSTDVGRTWAPVPNFPPSQEGVRVQVLVLPTSPVTILATTDSGLWKSTDQGATWRALPQAVDPVAYETQTPSFVYGLRDTLVVSADAGETWTPRAASPPGVLRVAPGTRTLYAFGPNDFSTSPDRGRHWSFTTESGVTPLLLPGFPGFPTRPRFAPGDPATAYAVAGARAFRSADGGATWASFATDREPLHSTVAQDLALDPAHPDRLYLATDHGVFRSADGGASWNATTSFDTHRLELAGRTLLAAGCGVQRSADGGRTWRATLPCAGPAGGFPRRIDRLIVDPRNPDVVYAGGLDAAVPPQPQPLHLWQSRDNGVSWKLLVADGNVVAVDPSRSGRLYVARPGGLLRSDDGGRTFRTIHPFAGGGLLFPLSALLVDPETPATLYAGSTTQGVWRSTDRGATWAPVNAGLTRYTDLAVRDLFLHPTVPHLLFAEVEDLLFQSRFTVP